ncbi:hypothetical protein [Kyrpidia tusciae]|uniref:LysM domain-containing protein n=1 Tax=Kyrpidia tusciae (strain DSM 2912 / NBRC 15312 / T2) TaxID=562970 RepID=D5WWJ6_KYRT2|nr:hypothetical protein [Kyrpidia tusciae]ADG07761.1 hypothetical protein Btus_3147 [Kyrpidia tusciae DSM 2912]
MKKSLLYSALALAVAGGGAAAVTAVAPFAVAAADTATTASGSTQPAQAEHHQQWGGVLSTAAQVLGVTPQQLAQNLRSGQSIAQVAQSKGVSEQQVIDAIVQKISASIDQKVQSGKLSQDKAAQMKANLSARVKNIVEHTGAFGKKGHPFAGRGIADAASILGMTPQDLLAQLKSGQSIADVAQSKGMSEAQLIDALMNKEKDALTKFVEHKWGGKKPAATTGSGPASQAPASSSNSDQSSSTTSSSTM